MGVESPTQTPGQAELTSLSGFSVSASSVSCAKFSRQWISDYLKPSISCKVAEETGNTICFLVWEMAQKCEAANESKHLMREGIW
jgi:hypothetical protein